MFTLRTPIIFSLPMGTALSVILQLLLRSRNQEQGARGTRRMLRGAHIGEKVLLVRGDRCGRSGRSAGDCGSRGREGRAQRSGREGVIPMDRVCAGGLSIGR